MALPIILSTGSSSGAGAPGEGRKDLEIGETVTLSDTEAANSGQSYAWTLVDRPIDSSASLTGESTPTPTFSPDVTGSYRIKCVVNSADESVEVIAVPLPNTNGRIPSFEEETQYDESGNVKGWHEAMTDFMRSVDSNLGDIAVAGEKIINTITIGTVDSHDSATPKRVHVFEFDPTDYDMAGATRSLVLRGVAANGGGVASTNIKLRNLTDAEDIATLNFTAAAFTAAETALTEGSGAGEIDQSPKLYEVQIYVDSPDEIDDSIELVSVNLEVVNTIN